MTKVWKKFWIPILEGIGKCCLGLLGLWFVISFIGDLAVLLEEVSGHPRGPIPACIVYNTYIHCGLLAICFLFSLVAVIEGHYCECVRQVECEKYCAPTTCKHPKEHRIYHAMKQQCPCDILKGIDHFVL